MEIEQTKKRPSILITDDLLEIKGPSYSEDIREFYKPTLDWLDESNPIDLECSFHYTIINSTSQKQVYQILIRLKKFIDNGINIKINWYYDDDDEEIMELGEDFVELIEIPMLILPVKKS